MVDQRKYSVLPLRLHLQNDMMVLDSSVHTILEHNLMNTALVAMMVGMISTIFVDMALEDSSANSLALGLPVLGNLRAVNKDLLIAYFLQIIVVDSDDVQIIYKNHIRNNIMSV